MQPDSDITGYLFEHARDIMLVIDASTGAIVGANHAAEVAYGYTRTELLTKKIFEFRVNTPAEVERQMKIANADGILFEAVHRRSDGSIFPVEVSSRGADIRGKRLLFSIIRDVTERKLFEREREHLLAATQRALSLRDDFLMIASHELRTPVTNFILQLERLGRLNDRGASREQVGQYALRALHESRRLASLIDTLLDAQVAKGELSLHLEGLDLREVVVDVVDRLQPHADQSGSKIVCELMPAPGRWDRLRMDQVMTNLLLNAIKYGRARPVTVVLRTDPSNAIIEVIDQGIGVAAQDVQRIFDKFERAVPASYGGLGLGLFITKQLVEAHGGEISMSSVPGDGSKVRVALPRAPGSNGDDVVAARYRG